MSNLNAQVPIAIVGMSCRFSGDSTNPEKFWRLLANGESGWSEIPQSRFNRDAFLHPFFERMGNMNVKGAHFLDQDIALFDAGFFGMSAETAATLDPQFRLQLESTYEALESAGIKLEEVAGSNTSVFGGTFFKDYHDGAIRDPETLPRLLSVGVGSTMASNRISHFYDLRGASISLDTACSTTLNALHQACQNLRTGESDMSIVGGSNVMLNPDHFIALSSLKLISAEGKSFAFDDRASGYGRGEGTATVILKRLDDAVKAGDPIRAVIRGSGANQDGKTDTITTPSQQAQEDLMKKVYQTSGLDPQDTTYFEAHGTGTPTGDPIECRAIASVFQHGRSKEQPLRIGSVKTNIGHTETTSGLASIIKVTLALERGLIPPSINFERPNPNIDLDGWNLKVPREVEAWPTDRGVRRASVNNFGYGGANAHVILESYQSYLVNNTSTNGHTSGNGRLVRFPEAMTNGHVNGSYINGFVENGSSRAEKEFISGDGDPNTKLFLLSAKDEQAVQAMALDLRDFLNKTEIIDEKSFLDSLAYTLGQRRSFFNWVAAHPAASVEGLIGSIDSGKFKAVRTRSRPRVGFVFTGQGAQWHAMGRELIQAYPLFKESLLEADEYLKEFGCDWSLMGELLKDAESSRVNEPAMSMPLCAAVQIALVRLLWSWGVKPSAITSHSSGEIAAAYAAGALTLENAMAIVYARGSVIQSIVAGDAETVAGGMLAVGLGPDELTKKYLPNVSQGQVVVGCFNSPTSVTASGDVPGIVELEKMLKRDGIFARRLKVEAAYHSHHMGPKSDAYLKSLQKLLKANGQIDQSVIFTSPTTGGRVTSGKLLGRPEHWILSLVSPVEFVQAFTNMCLGEQSKPEAGLNVDVIIEIGPHAALGGPIAEIVAQPEFNGIRLPYYSCLVRQSNAVDTMQVLASNLIREGYFLDIGAVNFPHGRDSASVTVLHDLPSYPWNHSIRHWAETRYNKSHRHRTAAPHDLLGQLAIGTNALAPSWRLIVRPLDMPWVRDHVIQGTILYPGGGYICAAIEGACQVACEPNQRILGIELRDIDIMAALVVPDTAEGIELQLNLLPTSNKALSAENYKEFHIYSVTGDNKWTEHCRGFISVEVVETASAEDESERRSAAARSKKFRPSGIADYRKRLDARDIYSALRSAGIYHGPIFQNLKTIRARSKESVAVIEVPDTAAIMPYQYQHAHVIHPATLDTIFQAAYTALPDAGSKMHTTRLPRSIKKLRIAHGMTKTAGHRLRAYSTLNHASLQSFDTDITVTVDQDDEVEPSVKIEGFFFQSIGDVISNQIGIYENDKFSKVEWAPHLALLKPENMQHLLKAENVLKNGDTSAELERTCAYYVAKTIANLTEFDVAKMTKPNQEFFSWMKGYAGQVGSDQIVADGLESTTRAVAPNIDLTEKTKGFEVIKECVVRLGSQLAEILTGSANPKSLLEEGHLFSRFYDEGLEWTCPDQQLTELVKVFAHTHPRGRVLEINAGTGGSTQQVLRALGFTESGSRSPAISYEFTDPSSQVLEAAKTKFSGWEDLITYKKFDVAKTGHNQEFHQASYDLVIASHIFSSRADSAEALKNIRGLLKPGGKLVLLECSNMQLEMQFIFGLLLGRGLSNSSREANSEARWNEALRDAGFDDIVVKDPPTQHHQNSRSVILATASSSRTIDSDIVIITAEQVEPVDWLTQLTSSITSITGKEPFTQNFDSAVADDKLVIFLPELENSVLRNPSEAQFETIKRLCIKSKGLLWLTRGGSVDCENPEANLAVGFLRCARLEYHGKRLASLDLDPNEANWSSEVVSEIAAVFRHVFDYSVEYQMQDFEFAAREGTVLIPRYYNDAEKNEKIFRNPTVKPVTCLGPFDQKERALRLISDGSGTLTFGDHEEFEEAMPQDFIEIEPRAFGINSGDFVSGLGLAENQLVSSECSGIVTKLGQTAIESGFKVGDRVAALSEEHIANRVRVHWTHAVLIPDDMSFESAATMPKSFAEAQIAIDRMARLRKGETILIHASATAFGQAAVTIAQHIGAEIFVTVGTDAEMTLMAEKYGIYASHIFSNKESSFSSDILRLTDGKGVDVLLNTLSGRQMKDSFNCTASFGSFINIPQRNREVNGALEVEALQRCVTFISMDLQVYAAKRGHDLHQLLKESIRMINEKLLQPISQADQFNISNLEEGLLFAGLEHCTGKVVLSINSGDMVQVLPPNAPKAKFQDNVSYLIVGGLGGIGKVVCDWMVDNGARNLIVLSRSAGTKALSMAAEMENRGCKLKAVSCDVSVRADVAQAIAACKDTMPPIKGVIQGAMVLEDSILEQMMVDQYKKAMQPKVQGTWNLHEEFEHVDLDFFVILSSLAGVIGFASQCNYAAGGTFQDALARYRTLRGLPCVSIDIGVVLNVGVVADNNAIEERLRKSGHTLLNEHDVIKAVESAIVSPPSSQMMIGLNRGRGPHWEFSGMARDARFAPLKYSENSSGTGLNAGSTDLGSSIASAESFEEAVVAVSKALREKIGEIFLVTDVEPNVALSELGVDSLVAVELRNMLALKAGAGVSIFDIMSSGSIADLAVVATSKSSFVNAGLKAE